MENKKNLEEKGKVRGVNWLETFLNMSGGDWYKLARFVLIILAVVTLGLFIINSVMDYRYKVVFIKTPCQLCQDLNKNQSQCIQGCFQYRINLYPDGVGGWRTENSSALPFNLSIVK